MVTRPLHPNLPLIIFPQAQTSSNASHRPPCQKAFRSKLPQITKLHNPRSLQHNRSFWILPAYDIPPNICPTKPKRLLSSRSIHCNRHQHRERLWLHSHGLTDRSFPRHDMHIDLHYRSNDECLSVLGPNLFTAASLHLLRDVRLLRWILQLDLDRHHTGGEVAF